MSFVPLDLGRVRSLSAPCPRPFRAVMTPMRCQVSGRLSRWFGLTSWPYSESEQARRPTMWLVGSGEARGMGVSSSDVVVNVAALAGRSTPCGGPLVALIKLLSIQKSQSQSVDNKMATPSPRSHPLPFSSPRCPSATIHIDADMPNWLRCGQSGLAGA